MPKIKKLKTSNKGGKRKKPKSKIAKKKKIAKVLREFKNNSLDIGTSNKKVKSRKQAIAIALSSAGMSKKNKGNKK